MMIFLSSFCSIGDCKNAFGMSLDIMSLFYLASIVPVMKTTSVDKVGLDLSSWNI